MKKLFESADRYLERSDWRDIALIKFCLCAVGLMIGVSLPKKHKKPALIAGAVLFAATYIPLMAKYLGIVREMFAESREPAQDEAPWEVPLPKAPAESEEGTAEEESAAAAEEESAAPVETVPEEEPAAPAEAVPEEGPAAPQEGDHADV